MAEIKCRLDGFLVTEIRYPQTRRSRRGVHNEDAKKKLFHGLASDTQSMCWIFGIAGKALKVKEEIFGMAANLYF